MKLVILFLLCLNAEGRISLKPQEVYDNYKKLMDKLFFTYQNLFNSVYSNDTINCVRDLSTTFRAIQRNDQWAIQLLDSIEKFKESMFWPGTKSECLNIVPEIITSNGTTIKPFKTHYCSLYMFLDIGVCLPATCKEKSVNSVFNIFREFTGENRLINLKCPSDDSRYLYDGYALFCVLLCLILLLIAAMGTIYDIMLRLHIKWKIDSIQQVSIAGNIYSTIARFDAEIHKSQTQPQLMPFSDAIFNGNEEEEILNELWTKNTIVEEYKSKNTGQLNKQLTLELQHQPDFESKLQKELATSGWLGHFLSSFSVYANMKTLFNVSADEKQICCLHGIRCVAALAVVFGHQWLFTIFIVDNLAVLADISSTLSFFLIVHGLPFSVDTFFLLSGLLICYPHLKKMSKNKPHSWISFYSKRLVRVSPSYWFVIFVLYFGFYLRGYFGPQDSSKIYAKKICEKNWWLSVLYIANWEVSRGQCFAVDWYLGVDMQFYWLSPILLYLMVNYKRWTIGLTSLLVVISSVTTSILTNHYDITVTLPVDSASFKHFMKSYNRFLINIYMRPYCRITPFLFGMMVGWILFTTNRQIHFKKFQIVLLWLLSSICFIAAVMIPYYFILTKVTTTIFMGFMYLLWTIALSILIILCGTGNGGIVESFLSWSGWFPFSRLTFGVYLVHSMVIEYLKSTSQRSEYLSFPNFNMAFLCLVFPCLVLSTGLYVTIERPIEKLTSWLK